MADGFAHDLSDAAFLLDRFRHDPATLASMERFAETIASALKAGGKVLSCGNGGSMADAMHFAEELSGRFHADRPALGAVALADPTHLTCVGNDYGFDFVFSRMVEAIGRPGDVLLVLSTSGNSANLLRAAESARAGGILVLGCLGRGGGPLLPLCDAVLMAPGTRSDRIQELHMLALHSIIGEVERQLGFA